MVRLIAALTVPVAVLSLAAADPVPRPKPETLYHPTVVGDTTVRTHYRVGSTVTSVVIDVAWMDDLAVVTEEQVVSYKDSPDDDYTTAVKTLVSDRGVFSLGYADGTLLYGSTYNLNLQAKPGEAWDAGVPRAVSKVLAPEEVAIPAGRFRTVPVEVSGVDAMGQAWKRLNWYAPRVGAIRYAEVQQGNKALLLFGLKSFTPGNGTLPPANSKPKPPYLKDKPPKTDGRHANPT